MDRTNKTRIGVVGATMVATVLAAEPSATLAQQAPRQSTLVRSPADTEKVVIDGIEFASWADYFASDYFRIAGKRCGTPMEAFADDPNNDGGLAGGSSGDCGSSTNPSATYAATSLKYRIPVVFHSITNGGTGTLTDVQIQNNIIVLNEDFKAMAGSPGAAGANGQIEFFLTNDFATALGGGSTTAGSGIMRYNNSTWYNDSGSYFNTIARTPLTYLNMYANSASGALGYVPFLPHSSPASVGTSSDRVVLLWAAVGDPCPVGGAYCTGRTATHEVGHYLGLYHTFEACGTASAPTCYSSGDRICDTNAVFPENYGCDLASNSCGDGIDNVRNYMDYSDDTCMNNFTQEQARRMRCTLEHRRSALPVLVSIFQGNFTGTPNTLSNNTNTSGTTLTDSRTQTGRSDGAGETVGAYTGNNFALFGDEVAYRINHPGGDFKVKLTGLSSDLDLMLLTAAGTPVSTFRVSNLGGSASERVVALGAAAGTYYAVVDTFATHPTNVHGSNFTIRYSRCMADTNDDNTVNVTDLLEVIGAWGSCDWCNPDVNDDTAVNVTDLLAVISAWGSCP